MKCGTTGFNRLYLWDDHGNNLHTRVFHKVRGRRTDNARELTVASQYETTEVYAFSTYSLIFVGETASVRILCLLIS